MHYMAQDEETAHEGLRMVQVNETGTSAFSRTGLAMFWAGDRDDAAGGGRGTAVTDRHSIRVARCRFLGNRTAVDASAAALDVGDSSLCQRWVGDESVSHGVGAIA